MKTFTLLKTFFANVLLPEACRMITTKSNLKMRISKLEIAHFKMMTGLPEQKKWFAKLKCADFNLKYADFNLKCTDFNLANAFSNSGNPFSF